MSYENIACHTWLPCPYLCHYWSSILDRCLEDSTNTTVCFQYGFNHIACTTPPGHLHPVKHTSFCFWALLYCLKRMSLLACRHIWFGLSTVPFNFMRGNLTARLPWATSIVFQYPSSLQLFAFRRSVEDARPVQVLPAPSL